MQQTRGGWRRARGIMVGPVTANEGKVVRPSQLIRSVRRTAGWIVRLVAGGQTAVALLCIMSGIAGAAEGTTCLSESLVAAILQDAAVQAYLHPEVPGRNPLRIAGLGLVNGSRLEAGQVRAVVVEWKSAAEPQVRRHSRCRASCRPSRSNRQHR